jgi:hypothetical protein
MKASGTKLTQLECVKAGTVWAGTQPGRRKKYSTVLLEILYCYLYKNVERQEPYILLQQIIPTLKIA